MDVKNPAGAHMDVNLRSRSVRVITPQGVMSSLQIYTLWSLLLTIVAIISGSGVSGEHVIKR